MSIELIEKYYGHASRNDFAGALQLFADDAEIVFFGAASIPLAGTYRGPAWHRALLSNHRDTLDDTGTMAIAFS